MNESDIVVQEGRREALMPDVNVKPNPAVHASDFSFIMSRYNIHSFILINLSRDYFMSITLDHEDGFHHETSMKHESNMNETEGFGRW
jgi:hypothetical protein